MDELNKRVLQVMDFTGVSKSQFAAALGISLPVLTHIASGRNKPSLDMIIRILQVYRHINVNWLLFGEGSIEAKTQKQVDVSAEIDMLQEKAKQMDEILKQLNEVVKYNQIFINEIKYLNQLNLLVQQQQKKGNALTQELANIAEQIKSKL